MKLRRDHQGQKRLRLGCLPILIFSAVTIVVGLAIAFHGPQLPNTQQLRIEQVIKRLEHLRAVDEFTSISDPQARSIALFSEAGRVIQSPRCMNCHPATDRPTQTDTMRPHLPWVTRGGDGGGALTMRCSTCHQDANFAPSGVPGNPKWRLAPIEMAWQGKTLGEICRQIQDPRRGGMTREHLLEHLGDDELVGWAWNPGGNRTPAPGTQAEFKAIIAAWLDTGAQCPE